MWRLVCEGRLDIGLIDSVSIDYCDAANRALDAYQDAERRAKKDPETK